MMRLHYQSNPDLLFITQSSVLQADWLMLKTTHEKAALQFSLPIVCSIFI